MSSATINVPNDWFKEWFDELYLDVYSHRDRSEARNFISKLPIWGEIAPKDWCLDLGCGAGRYSLEIAAKGLNVLGLDLSKPLLRKALDAGSDLASAWYVRADMRSIPVKSRFILIVSLFTSFGYFGDEDNRALLDEVRSLLQPAGVFILDVANPLSVATAIADKPVTNKDRNGMHITEERYFDKVKSRVNKHIEIDAGGKKRSYYESVRLYHPDEMVTLLGSCGFRQLHPAWGDYQGRLLTEESPRMIYFQGV